MASAGPHGMPLQQANAEIARLRRKVLRYRDEITQLRLKLEEPVYNEPESELERMQELQEEPLDAEPVHAPLPVGYLAKLRNRFKKDVVVAPVPWPPHPLVLVWSFIGAFATIAMLGALHQYSATPHHLDSIIPSMGASVVLLFSATASPLAQPWNTIVGHVTAAFVGVAVRVIFTHVAQLHHLVWLSGGIAIFIVDWQGRSRLQCQLHPPAGATALIAIMGPDLVWDQGWLYIVLLDATFLVLFAFLWDNLISMVRAGILGDAELRTDDVPHILDPLWSQANQSIATA